MKTGLVLVAAAVAMTSLAGCGTRKVLGLERSAPDEFRIITKAPLSLPPDYALRPPRPGEARPQLATSANSSVFGENTGQQASEGEKMLVAKAGASTIDPTVADQIDFEGATVVRKPTDYANRVLAPDPGAVAGSATDQESIRRVTGGGAVTIEPGRGATPAKLPGL